MTESDFPTLEAVGALVVVIDVDGRIVYWNGSCSDLTGYSLDEVRGRRLWDFLLVPEEVERMKAVFAEVGAVDHTHLFANYWVTKSGDRRWIAGSHSRAAGPDGRVQYFIKTGIDRTESKHSADRLAGIIDIVGEAIISVDDGQQIVLFNHTAETIFGWSAAEVIGQPLGMLLPERVRAIHGEHIRRFGASAVVARPMGEHRPEILGLRKNGEEFPAQAGISRLEADEGTLFTVALRDLTEQRRRQKERELLADMGIRAALAATRDYDETVTGIAGLAVRDIADCCVVAGVGREGDVRRLEVVHRDPGQTKRCEILQRALLDLVSSVLESQQPCLIAEVSSQYLESIAHDPEQLRALGELAPRSMIAVPISTRGELLGALVLVALPPSHRYGRADLQLAEEFANQAALALENAARFEDDRRVTRDMREANEQLVSTTIRAQESLEAAEAARAETEERERQLHEVAELREMFIGIVGHDLRNPLAAIRISAAFLLGQRRLDADGENAIARITKSSQRMSRMIGQLLDLTRARLGGGFPLERSLTDLRDVCRDVVQEFEAPIRLEVEGEVTGNWDPDRLEEALSNLVGNAIEHAAPGTDVSVRAHAADAGQAMVEVSNRGEPIPAHVLPFIFEPFPRGKARETAATGNLGLGLYIANQIVLAHGGTLDARSADGTTTFAIHLPRRRSSAIP